MNIVVTGGAGFVGSAIAVSLKLNHPAYCITCVDNLRRRGSEMNLEKLAAHGIKFQHGDIRHQGDFPDEHFDVLLECSAEPSVLAGYNSPPNYAIDTNLGGTVNCLNECRKRMAHMIFISTSRVYPIRLLSNAGIVNVGKRFMFSDSQAQAGISAFGVSERLPIVGFGPRSIYGTTKAASEMLCEEYASAYGLPITINRCGVLTGPGQLARADQGVFAFWMLCHVLRRPLKYIGFDGLGYQSRDLLHIEDLARLVSLQIRNPDKWNLCTFNVGGGPENTLSLFETSELCRAITGHSLDIFPCKEDRPMDIPCYYSDNRNILAYENAWKPSKTAGETLQETFDWMWPIRATLERVLFSR